MLIALQLIMLSLSLKWLETLILDKKRRTMEHHYYFILNGKETVPVEAEEWNKWFEENYNNRTVAFTKQDNIEISTIFLGLNHNFSWRGAPLLFETMVFHNGHGQECVRTANWEEAEIAHHAMVRTIFSKNYIKNEEG
jgi:hypothetical protein